MRLKEFYQKEVIPKFKKQYSLKNDLRVPRLVKIVVNAGIGDYTDSSQKLQRIEEDLARITGQKPLSTKAKKAISGFKLKKGQLVGYKITLRGKRMYDFLEKMIHIAFPRTRDFKGIKANFDGQGNLTIGFREQTVFPEVEEGTDLVFGFSATIVTTAKNNQEAKDMLSLLGLPFTE
jgi:large subunit ribosomal protein L5